MGAAPPASACRTVGHRRASGAGLHGSVGLEVSLGGHHSRRVVLCAAPGFPWREGFRRRLLTQLSAQRAAAVVTVSQFSADEIHDHLETPKAIVLAPQGAPEWRGGPAGPDREPPAFRRHPLQRRHTPEPWKRWPRAAGSQRPGLSWWEESLSTIDPEALARSAGLTDAFTWKLYVSDAELDELHASARAFAFLSDYEGFAMTPMEAAAHGAQRVARYAGRAKCAATRHSASRSVCRQSQTPSRRY